MLTEKQKILALAYLKTDKKPKAVSDQLGIPYSAVLKLRKELLEAEQRKTIHELFNMDEAALETLLETVKESLEAATAVLDANINIGETVTVLSSQVNGLAVLEENFQQAATALTKQITLLAIASSEASTVVMLAEALSELQKAFFAKGTNVAIVPGDDKFLKYLRD